MAVSSALDDKWPVGTVTVIDAVRYADMELPSSLGECTRLNLSMLDVSGLTELPKPWLNRGITKLSHVDLSGWDTSSVVSATGMFRELPSAEYLDLSGWDTSNFENTCGIVPPSVEAVDISGWSLLNRDCYESSYSLNYWGSSVNAFIDSGRDNTTLKTMRAYNVTLGADCSFLFKSLTSLREIEGVETWYTTRAVNMSCMFSGCSKLTSLDLSSWNLKNVTDTSSMFDGCRSLSSLDMSGWDTSGVTDMGNMFSDCTALATVKMGSGWSTARATVKPTFAKTMYNESGDSYTSSDAVPDGAHTYTDANPLQTSGMRAASSLGLG